MSRRVSPSLVEMDHKSSNSKGREVATIVVQFEEKLLESVTTSFAPACKEAGLEVRAFYGTIINGSRSLYVSISAMPERLLAEAEALKWQLPLNKDRLRGADITLNKSLAAEGFQWDPDRPASDGGLDYSIPRHQHTFMPGMDPYERVFAPYIADKGHLFEINEETGCPLRPADALQLLRAIVEQPKDMHGAGINLDQMVTPGGRKKRLSAVRWYSVHDEAGQEKLVKEWLHGCCLSFNQPVDAISEYMGPRVAYHFAFMSHLTSWSVLPALVGVAIFAHQIYNGSPGVGYLPAYGLFTAVWVTLTLEFWKRKQASLAMRWGMSFWAESEPLRAEYIAHPSTKRTRSFVDGKPTYWSSPGVYKAKLTGSTIIVSTAIGIVIAVVFSIFVLRAILTLKYEKQHGGPIPDGYGNHITSVLNAVQVQLLNFLYSKLAYSLTNYENHPTASSYDNSLVVKLAIFYAINAYMPLLWVAAIKNYVTIAGQDQHCAPNKDGVPDCFPELQSQLAIMLVTRIVISNFTEFGLPLVMKWGASAYKYVTRVDRDRQSNDDAALDTSAVQADASKPTYDVFDDYLEVLISWGYVCLFVVAFPLAPAIALVANAFEVRMDAWKILRLHARPMPKGAASIGAWQLCFEAMTFFAVIVNATIVVFTDTSPLFGHAWGLFDRLVFFVVAEHVILGLKYVISEYIPDKSFETTLQLERAEYLVKKHIMGVKDRTNRDGSSNELESEAHDGSSSGVPRTPQQTGVGSAVDHAGLMVYDSYWEMVHKPIPSVERKRQALGQGAVAGGNSVSVTGHGAVVTSLPPSVSPNASHNHNGSGTSV